LHANNSVLNSYAPAETGALQLFYAKAENDLTGIRSGILIFLQDPRSTAELDSAIRNLRFLKLNAETVGQDDLAARATECANVLTDILSLQSAEPEQDARRALDLIAEIEASLLNAPLGDDVHSFSISGFLDESFRKLAQGYRDEQIQDEPESEAGFEIDEETLEIFRSEASGLLENISENLDALAAQPNDFESLWNIRRCAHTFKGAAGIVGLGDASALAHRVEDLLDQLAEDRREADASIIELLTTSTCHLRSLTLDCGPAEQLIELSAIYAEFDRILADGAVGRADPDTDLPKHLAEAKATETRESHVHTAKPPPAPIVRVALDRLDELLNLTRTLATNRSSLAKELVFLGADNAQDILEKIGPLFDAQRQLTNEIQDKLLRIRMVRFGMLATRLNRAVHVTCQEENKKAEVMIDNEDFEIDTQILDSLVEPLLHLLRNAIVHGIESPERRRLIGKPEKGKIWIEVRSGDNEIILSVRDDGRGISISKLREKAVASGVIDRASADSMTDEQAFDLMFLRGITTAENLSLNAGRGVGMSIVKESIGSIGGSISISTEAQKGTTFRIRIPLVLAAAAFDQSEAGDDLFSDVKGEEAKSRAAGLNVLIVDDSSSMRQLITRMVEKAGCKGIPATDGRNAVEILSDPENHPDIILTDLEMPNMDGYEFLEFLKNDAAFCEIPVVMITSRSGLEHRQKAFDLGVVDFMTKPFSEDSLMDTINRVRLATTIVQ